MLPNHARLQELFLAACDLPESQQQAMLDEQCANDPEPRQELQLLLRTDARKGGIFADDKTTDGIQFQFDTVVDSELPKQIGQYEVKEILGEGGMGVVYLAQQQNPRRDVAVKVIRSGMVSPELLKRFELEAAVLGRLTHPAIASIYEAGVFIDSSSDQERPFLAMEYVDGKPLREFVQQSDPGTRDRLRLFVQICEAVHHAHQRGVIHRDLKPGNVLVKDDGQPSILDFGVARATGMDPGLSTLQTRAGQLIGTLPYMSPEQVAGQSLDVDTRSDVYSLGVIAYELLSGKLPYDVDGAEYLIAAKAISEVNPTPLSSINREFRGDLNTVILKALEKDPERRYQSAKAFGDDVQRYLENQPVVARPATAWYQLRQFSKRNKALVAGFLVSIALLVGGVVGTTRGMINAQQEAARKNAVNEFMKDILIAEDAKSGNPDIKMMEVLRAAAAKAPERFRDYPELEAEICYLLGTAFYKISMDSDAIALYRRAFELHHAELGLAHKLTRQAGAELVTILAHYDANSTIELASQLLENTPPSALQKKPAMGLQIAIAKAQTRQNNFAPAVASLRRLYRVVNGRHDRDEYLLHYIQSRLAVALRGRIKADMSNDVDKDVVEVTRLFREAIDFDVHNYGDSHQSTLRGKFDFAIFLISRMKWQEAETILREIIDLASFLGADHHINVQSMESLAWVLYQRGNFDEGADLFLESVDRHRRRGPLGNNVWGIVMLTDGMPIIEAGGKFAEGEEFARILINNLMGPHGDLANSHRLYLARFLSGQGKTAEAEKEFEQVSKSADLITNIFLDCTYNLFMGEHHLANGDLTKAAELFAEAMRIRKPLTENSIPTIARIEDSIKRTSLAESLTDDD